ncbi:MAG: hypothetical protein ABI691_13840 [Ginsengibacter sp.]
MKPDFTNTQLLTQYLDGELTPESAGQLQQRINTDKDLEEELENLKISLEAVKSFGLRGRVSAIHTGMMKEVQQQTLPKKGKIRNLTWYSLRIAAAVLIIAGSAIFYQYITLSSTSLYEKNFSSYTLHENRGADNKSVLQAAYESANYTAAINSFEKTPIKNTQDYFLAGNAYLYLDKPSDAIQCFLAIQQLNNQQQTHQYTDDAEYYLAMSYLKNNEPAKALLLFEQIHTDKNHLYNSKVSSWFLQKIKWVK